jgi:hypothetical protein
MYSIVECRLNKHGGGGERRTDLNNLTPERSKKDV